MATTTTTTSPRIAIIGGGLAGLVCLRVLHLKGIPATLYERDASLSARSHLGGSLDLHPPSGQRALDEAGLLPQFLKLSRPEGEEMKMVDNTGTILFHDDGVRPEGHPGRGERPEIDRTVLRKLLLDSVPPESIKWGHAYVSAQPSSSSPGEHIITFANGVETTCDLLIGADGARSRVRSLVSSSEATYAGLNGAELSLSPETLAIRPDLAEKVGNGNMFAMAKGKSLLAQKNGDGRVRVYAWFPTKTESDFVLPADDAKEAKRALLANFEEWAGWLRELIELADESAIYPRPLYVLPVGHRWDAVPGVTLLGDAAHLMSPYAGEGANVAMEDGLRLALALAEGTKTALREFEEEMFVRAGKAAAESDRNLKLSLEENGGMKLLATMGPPPGEGRPE